MRESYPLLRVRCDRIVSNGRALIKECGARGVGLWAVSKGMSGHPEIARAFERAGFETIADSRLDNIRAMRGAGVALKYALIRIPMRSELEELAELCDYTLISDLGTLAELKALCERAGRSVGAVIMFDVGDLREGFWFRGAREAAREAARCDGDFLRIAGVGANFACASGVLPSAENFEALRGCGAALEEELGRPLEIWSGGGTCSLSRMREGLMPARINNLRIGEGLLLGYDTAFDRELEGLARDTMRLEAELVEARRKPTLPVGETGRDAFGNLPVFEDRGERRRGILALGKQDVNISGLTPLDEGVRIITASSDHLLVDIEERPDLDVGCVLSFRPDYTAMLSASTSPYVTKLFEG
ncbi:MAG: alanine racemase [Synergistaceae bacterium]|nr:alanine racemase [Synergistaceae bacterium]